MSISSPKNITKRTFSKPPFYYRLIISLLKPLYRLQVWQRSHKRDNYQQEVAQRFGKRYPPRPVSNDSANNKNNININNNNNNKLIWCHAVSLGETNTVAPLLEQLLQQGYQIWLTNTTQTGFARGASRFADDIASGRLSHSYVPVDSPAVIKTFLAHVQPIAALFVETELWANTLAILAQQNIPSIMVNARLSAASFQRYQKISAVSKSMMQNLTLIIAQDEDSAQRFQQLGADSSQVQVAGSLKWVINAPKTHLSAHQKTSSNPTTANKNPVMTELEPSNRPIWVAASTHGGEEKVALSWQQQLLALSELNTPLLILVPRHPERFDEVANLIQQSGLQMARRSKNEPVTAQTHVYLADSMGELMTWFALADVALVGGSLVDIGGHNPVEPASVATPILMGRYTQSCQTVVDKLASVGALYQPHNDHYQVISFTENIADNKAFADNQNSNPTGNSLSNEHTDDDNLIYHQLSFWLNNLKVAKIAGQAGEQLTAQQQSALSQQLTLIKDVIHQFDNI